MEFSPREVYFLDITSDGVGYVSFGEIGGYTKVFGFSYSLVKNKVIVNHVYQNAERPSIIIPKEQHAEMEITPYVVSLINTKHDKRGEIEVLASITTKDIIIDKPSLRFSSYNELVQNVVDAYINNIIPDEISDIVMSNFMAISKNGFGNMITVYFKNPDILKTHMFDILDAYINKNIQKFSLQITRKIVSDERLFSISVNMKENLISYTDGSIGDEIKNGQHCVITNLGTASVILLKSILDSSDVSLAGLIKTVESYSQTKVYEALSTDEDMFYEMVKQSKINRYISKMLNEFTDIGKLSEDIITKLIGKCEG